ncbi:MAG TPA: amidase [Paracoccus sp. (in: a-proteobacteria)]|uniref:amidase n=1 Tax=Paracoccus sp. TaxID=267 RepID=UPI002CD23AD3|nr:amidase [Paracoccus sp. (in: a-proteobacteria)]HWL55814.1 amidase [Paracoccus sp. (in: a-proteobacteria)]
MTTAIATPSDDQITGRTALDLSRSIHAGKLSCAEVMAAHLDRIERLNPRFNAIISLRPREKLMAEARAADADLAAGRSRGWLHGLPQAPKDLSDTAGILTVMGSPAMKDRIPHADAIQVERIRAAGAILIGKTNTPEFGLGSHSYNPVFGTTLNAWDTRLSAGGSSGGAAVALATGMLPVADGSDMMGSLRNPAGWNNVYGFRPSFGRVPSAGPELYLNQLSGDGPMARNVADLAMLLATQAGHDPRDPLSLIGDGEEFARPLDAEVKGKRIGWLGDLGGYLATEPGVLETCEAALAHFETLGCVVEPASTGFAMERLWDAWITLRSWLVAGKLGALYDDPATRDLLKPEAIWEIERGRNLTAMQVHAASVERSAWFNHLRGLYRTHDFLVLPTAQLFPFDAREPWPREVGGRVMDTYHRWMEVVIPGSLAGIPVLAVPAGFGPSGAAMGLQIMAPHLADRAVLELGHAYDRVQPYTARRNPLLA